jgi:3D (Asp-Asp-Asp) domain-containing protein
MTAILALTMLGSIGLQQGDCSLYTITSYSAERYPGVTHDGTTTTWGALNRGEHIAAGSWNLPEGSWVWVEGEGIVQIRDRGNLEARQVDLLRATQWEAKQVGRTTRLVCRVDGPDS